MVSEQPIVTEQPAALPSERRVTGKSTFVRSGFPGPTSTEPPLKDNDGGVRWRVSGSPVPIASQTRGGSRTPQANLCHMTSAHTVKSFPTRQLYQAAKSWMSELRSGKLMKGNVWFKKGTTKELTSLVEDTRAWALLSNNVHSSLEKRFIHETTSPKPVHFNHHPQLWRRALLG